MTKIKYTKEQSELIQTAGMIINTRGGDTYYHLPQWFKKTDQDCVFEEVESSAMPDEVKERWASFEDLKNWIIGYLVMDQIHGPLEIGSRGPFDGLGKVIENPEQLADATRHADHILAFVKRHFVPREP